MGQQRFIPACVPEALGNRINKRQWVPLRKRKQRQKSLGGTFSGVPDWRLAGLLSELPGRHFYYPKAKPKSPKPWVILSRFHLKNQPVAVAVLASLYAQQFMKDQLVRHYVGSG
jgi:hypothetical protein